MGNCLIREEKVIRVMKTDGKILEYQPPIKVHQVLSDFSAHALSDSFAGFHHLRPNAKLLPGLLYYLIFLPSPTQKSKKKTVRFSNVPDVNDEQGRGHGIVRIKLMISKKELQDLVQKGVSVHDLASQMHKSKQSTNGDDIFDGDNCRRRWKPALESIAEVN
ncbi:hypothetical protein F3Y22_tig00002840pilonHSYRG00267 [Hibiscus syriacus]|uniref:Uncharacterized protein n=1 Tax=Hibiscus syriacus TaxID=106335 RepID=A0A6A3CP07_HIBSY|nr:uncharacterized protein LOC120153165 [Hibiscus syriacus]KAE8731110.1 hypothetical protein F3Y22_tig00002840pilonHSYRG00267 [Hibiscus syriacus]